MKTFFWFGEDGGRGEEGERRKSTARPGRLIKRSRIYDD